MIPWRQKVDGNILSGQMNDKERVKLPSFFSVYTQNTLLESYCLLGAKQDFFRNYRKVAVDEPVEIPLHSI